MGDYLDGDNSGLDPLFFSKGGDEKSRPKAVPTLTFRKNTKKPMSDPERTEKTAFFCLFLVQKSA